MRQKNLCVWLRLITAGMALCGLVICLWIIPSFGKGLAEANPEYERAYLPWLIFVWLTSVPCFAALVCAWRVAGRIGAGRSFSMENARSLKIVSLLAAGDSAFLFTGNAVLLLLNLSHAGVMLVSLVAVFIGASVSVAAAALSHLVRNAAELQLQSELTI